MSKYSYRVRNGGHCRFEIERIKRLWICLLDVFRTAIKEHLMNQEFPRKWCSNLPRNNPSFFLRNGLITLSKYLKFFLGSIVDTDIRYLYCERFHFSKYFISANSLQLLNSSAISKKYDYCIIFISSDNYFFKKKKNLIEKAFYNLFYKI